MSLFSEGSDVFSETWPSSGSMRSGSVYRRPAWAPRTADTGSSSALGPLLPTPEANIGSNGGPQHPDKRREGGHSVSLQDVAFALMPTPSVADAMGGHASRSGARSNELLLPGLVKTLLPTPTADPYGSNQSPSPGAAVRPSLESLAPKLLPTPTTTDAFGARNATARRNNPRSKHHAGTTLTDALLPDEPQRRKSSGASTSPPSGAGSGQ